MTLDSRVLVVLATVVTGFLYISLGWWGIALALSWWGLWSAGVAYGFCCGKARGIEVERAGHIARNNGRYPESEQ